MKGEEGEREGEKRRRKGRPGEKRSKREVDRMKAGCLVQTAANRGGLSDLKGGTSALGVPEILY